MMIFFLAGTRDARELAVELQNCGYQLLASVVTDSAAASLREAGLTVSVGRKTAEEMHALLQQEQFSAVVDASHPFAEIASENAMKASALAGIPYFRYERPGSILSDHPLITYVRDYHEAAEVAREQGGNIFLATGAKTLHIFAEKLLGLEGIRLIARMLPTEENLRKCHALGIPQKNIVAMQGPFAEDLNQALYRHYQVTTLITKESGTEGSVREKINAALENGINVIVILRPNIDYGTTYHSIAEMIRALEKSSIGGD